MNIEHRTLTIKYDIKISDFIQNNVFCLVISLIFSRKLFKI